jgi:hypothetical protein
VQIRDKMFLTFNIVKEQHDELIVLWIWSYAIIIFNSKLNLTIYGITIDLCLIRLITTSKDPIPNSIEYLSESSYKLPATLHLGTFSRLFCLGIDVMLTVFFRPRSPNELV